MTTDKAVERLIEEARICGARLDPLNAAMVNDLCNMLASLTQPKADEDGWQPIETAPKDGTTMLVNHAEHALIGYGPSSRPSRQFALARWTGIFWETGVPGGHAFGGADDQFTHWMPLPDPPEQEPD